jgi:hypothetical protein
VVAAMIGEVTEGRLEKALAILDEGGIAGDAHARSVVRDVDAYGWPDHYVLGVAEDLVRLAKGVRRGEDWRAVDRH